MGLGQQDEQNPFAAPKTFSTPELPLPEEVMDAVLATRGSRFAGRLIDQLLLLVCIVPGFVYMAVLEEEVGGIALMAFPAVTLVGYQWYLISTTGQSLAKKWLKMRIIKLDGSRVNFVSGVLLRNWIINVLGVIPTVGSLISLVDAVMIFGEEQRCLHDHIAGTKVIDVTMESFD